MSSPEREAAELIAMPEPAMEEIVLDNGLINGETLEGTWQRLSMKVTPDGHEAFEAALGDMPVVSDVRSDGDLSIVVQGNEIRVGRVVDTFDPAKLLSWEELDCGDTPGVTKLTLVPADSNKVARPLEAAGA